MTNITGRTVLFCNIKVYGTENFINVNAGISEANTRWSNSGVPFLILNSKSYVSVQEKTVSYTCKLGRYQVACIKMSLDLLQINNELSKAVASKISLSLVEVATFPHLKVTL